MNIVFYNKQTSLKICKKKVKILVNSFLKLKNISNKKIMLYFVEKSLISKLHKKFFQDPSPTDCITFPMCNKNEIFFKEHTILGEIFICPKVAIERCREFGNNAYKELSVYIIHSILHLLGYRDNTIENKYIMKKEENKYIEILEEKKLLL